MKTTLAKLEVLFVGVAVASLAACGGGGDDAPAPPPVGSATPVPPPQSNPLPPAPTPASSGLTAPGLQLTLNANDAVMLARKMFDAGAAARGAAATLQLGVVDAGIRGAPATSDCPIAGTVSYAITGPGTLSYTYSGCQVGAYTFNGTSSVRTTVVGGAVESFVVDFSGLQVNAPDTPATVSGQLNCRVPPSGAAPACISSYEKFIWGWDMALTADAVSGTHQCTCGNGSWNVAFDEFKADSGMAYVYATNGTAIVARTAAKTFNVVLTVDGTTQAFDITLN